VPNTIDTEHRAQLKAPNLQISLSGKFPALDPNRSRYGLSAFLRTPTRTDEYRTIVSNPAGDFIDKDGTTLSPPDQFTPDDFSVRTAGGDAGFAYRFTSWLQLATKLSYSTSDIEGKNEGPRWASELRENRPYTTFSGTALGRVGKGRGEYIIDAGSWSTGNNDERWFSTLSQGTGQTPITGRGIYQFREEKGSELRGRFKWTQGKVAVGLAARRFHRDVDFTLSSNDAETFNAFLRRVASIPKRTRCSCRTACARTAPPRPRPSSAAAPRCSSAGTTRPWVPSTT
jgi:hypothetical protein